MNVIWSIFRLPGQSPISLSKQGSRLSSKRHGDFGRETGRGSLSRISRVAGGLPGPGPSPGGGRSDTKTISRLQGTWSFPGFHYDLDDLDAYAAYAGSFSAYSRQIIVETVRREGPRVGAESASICQTCWSCIYSFKLDRLILSPWY